MAFFSAVSSSIGKKLLLFGLRQIDILDKDPADFVSVDVGKKTTLEVRDVGLHIKKLVALLHLKLPPEVHLSKARASLLRVTFILDFGVPQILIDIDGIQVHAHITDLDGNGVQGKPRGKEPQPPRSQAKSTSPRRRKSSPHPSTDDTSDASSEEGDEHIPTVDDLAQSFIREEPEEEIRELEEALHSQSEHMQASIASTDDGDDELPAGVGAPLGLPGVLRNLLNTALDRLKINANQIDIEFEDQTSAETSNLSGDDEDSSISLNFHVERVSIDSLTSTDPRVNISSATPSDPSSNSGRRRLRVEKICARLVSDAENFASLSRISRPISPITTRSEASSSHKVQSEPSTSRVSIAQEPVSQLQEETIPSLQSSIASIPETNDIQIAYEVPARAVSPLYEPAPLTASVLTTDDDRFADAGSEDGLGRSMMNDHLGYSQQSFGNQDLTASSILYDDAGIMDYAIDNNLLDSTNDLERSTQVPHRTEPGWQNHDPHLSHSYDPSSSTPLPTASALQRLADSMQSEISTTRSEQSDIVASTNSLDVARKQIAHDIVNQSESVASLATSDNEELAESKLFTHEDAESMYMSAMSAAPTSYSQGPAIPGGWDSSSSSSQGTASDTSAPIPANMTSGSILGPLPEVEDGCETPRPGSRQSTFPSTPRYHARSQTNSSGVDRKLAKQFLSIDEITVWFPLGLSEDQPYGNESSQTKQDEPELVFSRPSIGEDSIFQDMPGSFSNYAQSSSRKKDTIDLSKSIRKRVDPKSSSGPSNPPKKAPLPAVNVEVGSIVGHIDFSTGHILFKLIQRLAQVMVGEPTAEKSSPPSEPAKDVQPSVDLSIKHFGIAWLESLMTESHTAGEGSNTALEISPMNAIIRVGLSAIYAKSQGDANHKQSKVAIGKFVLGSLDQEIISFQKPRPRSRRSTYHTPGQLSNDMEIVFDQAKEQRITVITRPVKVAFDLTKIDEALGSFGGFSGMLELGSSISSGNITPAIPVSPPPSRGVRFNDNSAPILPPDKSSSGSPKIDIRFDEVNFILQGKSCALHLQTTAVKAAIRATNIRMKVSEVHISGPHVDNTKTGAPLLLDVKDTTIDFRFTPEETDLDRLISMINPSKDPYENDEDILIETLLRQRRKGSVVRVDVGNVALRISDLEQLRTFDALGIELARLSRVTKYLPDDDRPGLLSLVTVHDVSASVTVNEKLGDISASLEDASIAHVGVPSLLAVEVLRASASRGHEILVHEVVELQSEDPLPMIMARVIGDEMEPLVKAKLFNFCVEYHVSTIMALLGINDTGTVDDIALGLASSVATITGASTPSKALSRQSSESSSPSTTSPKPLHIDLLLRSCALGLNPRKIASKGLFVLTDAHLLGRQAKADYSVTFQMREASFHAIDDVGRIANQEDYVSTTSRMHKVNQQLKELRQQGYVSLSHISAAEILVNITGDGKEAPQLVDVEFKSKLLVLESCADSTQTLIAILNGLQPPSPPNTAQQFRTVVPLQEMMESFTGDALFTDADMEEPNFMENADLVADEVPTNLEFVGSFYNHDSLPTEEDLGDSMLGEDDLGALAIPPIARKHGDRGFLESFHEQYEVTEGETSFDFIEKYFIDSDSDNKGTARKWNSAQNQYHLRNDFKTPDAPLKVRVREMNVVWNLFDGYDWPRTRDIIAEAVDNVEARAEERRQHPPDDDDDEYEIEQDFLFNSVWIGVPVHDEKGALARRINRDIDDLASETGSNATSTATRSTSATARPRSATKSSHRKLKLERSKRKKIAFELSGVSVDLVVFPPNSGETQNSLSVGVYDLVVYDYIPTSTWNKFVTSLLEPNKREQGRPMIKLELQTVKPVTELAASELVLKVAVIPLRLHVDQDALDFITRFFEFKDDTVAAPSAPSDQPFIQRLEVMTVTLKLDYKPKRVDYRGLRSGHTTEFMNFLILDGADIILQRAILYGVTSLDKLEKMLNAVWMPDVRKNQLPGVLSGLAAIRPLVNVGSGVRDLVVVPMREYKKDGRIVRSLQKGVYAFAKNTTTEAARLGARVAIGAQNILEGAETILNPQSASPRSNSTLNDWDELNSSDTGEDEPQAVSNYANQPIGVKAGLRSAARYLERDLLTARDAIIAIPTEVMEEGTGMGMAKVLARRAPTVILRPALGATKAIGNTLLGVGNALDKDSKRKIEDKYKPH
ncbi:hypothetical protein B0J11DRAFT_563608 [Dendryphion nanum]|uniref:Autophagy-related protein 2 n=1 Tax=Dendryphion nanum TaxID=256645 RepID=A0A9P9J0A2_9PLEO|nr:hypothetical protein B0J11DRAFT_563608 [Dendryphion nanum]